MDTKTDPYTNLHIVFRITAVRVTMKVLEIVEIRWKIHISYLTQGLLSVIQILKDSQKFFF